LYSQPFVSSVSSINNASKTIFQLAGNPVNDMLLLNVHNRVNAHGEFALYDAQGRIVKRMQRTLHEGHYQVTMPVSELSPGNYFIRYEAVGLSMESARFVKR
jgi:hypothetical protein